MDCVTQLMGEFPEEIWIAEGLGYSLEQFSFFVAFLVKPEYGRPYLGRDSRKFCKLFQETLYVYSHKKSWKVWADPLYNGLYTHFLESGKFREFVS